MNLIIFILQLHLFVQAEVPVTIEGLQLQKIINQSEIQIRSLKEILNYSAQDSKTLERAGLILEKLTAGLDKSIEQYHGTNVYSKALIDLQSMNDFQNTYSDSQYLSKRSRNFVSSDEIEILDKKYENLIKFQKDSVQANQSDIDTQVQLQQALISAGPGFVPKIQTQAELGNWQTNIRLSAQLTELLDSIQAMREELRLLRYKENSGNIVDKLISGVQVQNQKQRGTNNR